MNEPNQSKPADLSELFRNIKLLLMDCDGVMTDGRLYFSERGEELKVFHVRDGQGLSDWHRAGFDSGIISGRDAGAIIAERADELGIRFVKVKSGDKVADFHQIIEQAGVAANEVVFIGDDVGDVALMKLVGLPVAVADATDIAKAHAAYVTAKPGGHGAVREIIDLLLSSH